MKRYFLYVLICMFLFSFHFVSMAEDPLVEADTLFEKGDITSIREYANLNLEQELEGWKDICKKYGKDGMGYGEKAKELEPGKIEGHYYYGLCVASYSDGVSILKALKEGLKGSTQDAFYTAYKIDKMFEDGGPILCIARFWHKLPFPLTNKSRAQKYFEEHHKYFPDDPRGLVYFAELLIDRGKKDEARLLLEKAVAGDEPYYCKWAKRLLEDL